MRYTITGYYGDDLFGDLKVCAKTGTAEIGNGKDPNAWMVGYSQDEDCPLAFACVVEDSGFGIEYAGPVAEAGQRLWRRTAVKSQSIFEVPKSVIDS